MVMRLRFRRSEDLRDLRRLIPKGSSVVELGARDANFLEQLEPSRGLVVFDSGASSPPADLPPACGEAIEMLSGDIESHEFLSRLGGDWDFILVRDVLVWLRDCETFFDGLRLLCSPDSRVVFVSHSVLWRPFIRLSQMLGITPRAPEENVLSTTDLECFAKLADFERCCSETRQLFPFRLLIVGPLVNRLISPLPLIRRLNLRWYSSFRLLVPEPLGPQPSVSVIVPARNEEGNIMAIVERTPDLCPGMELIFVEGNSQDETHARMLEAQQRFPDRRITVLQQPGKGKYDAVKTGFDAATGEILMILDADMTVPPEDLPRFYRTILSGKGEMVMGTRLVYPLEDQSMRFLNVLGNRMFSRIFSWLLGQPITDTLCGTKVMTRRSYQRIAAGREWFGDFDPFGDFDLIFGAARLQLSIVEIPIRYQPRSWGVTQISRFRNGLTLARMVIFGYWRFKIT
jgi:hypothetical protein